MDPVQSWIDAKEVRRMAESLMTPPLEIDPKIVDAGYGDSFEGFADNTAPDNTNESSVQSQPKQREAVENSLARAQQLAQGSGMLRSTDQTVAKPTAAQESQRVDRALPPDSPFKVSTHQDLTEQVPMAQQLTPPEENLEPPAKHTSRFGRGVAAEVESSGSRGPFLDRLYRFSTTVRQDYGARAMFLIDNDGQVILDEVENPKLIQVARTLANASYTAHRQSAGSAAVGNLHVKIGANATLEVVPVNSRYGLLVLGIIFPAPLGADRVLQLTGLLERAVDPAG